MPQLYALFVVQNVEPVGGHVPEWMLRYIGGCKKHPTHAVSSAAGGGAGRRRGRAAGGRTRSITTCFSGSSE